MATNVRSSLTTYDHICPSIGLSVCLSACWRKFEFAYNSTGPLETKKNPTRAFSVYSAQCKQKPTYAIHNLRFRGTPVRNAEAVIPNVRVEKRPSLDRKPSLDHFSRFPNRGVVRL